jgi:hypothetical protein
MVQVSIGDFIHQGSSIIPVGQWYTRQYPLRKKLLRYEHNFAAGFSHPVWELFAMVTDVEYADRSGKIVVDGEHIDVKTRIPHQERTTGEYEMDDANLRAMPFTEIFISTERGDRIIDSARIRDDIDFVPYVSVGAKRKNVVDVPRTRAGDSVFNYQKIEILEDWKCPDGTIFTKRTESEQKVAKPPFWAPVQQLKQPGRKRMNTSVVPEKIGGGAAFTRAETLEDWKRPDDTIFTEKTEGVWKVIKPIPPAPVPPPPITVTIPVHHWNKPRLFGGGNWDYNIRQEQVTVPHGAPIPTAIELNSDWSFSKYRYN